MKPIIIFVCVIGALIAIVASMFIFQFCPPQGPWPMPPWCSIENLDSNNNLNSMNDFNNQLIIQENNLENNNDNSLNEKNHLIKPSFESENQIVNDLNEKQNQTIETQDNENKIKLKGFQKGVTFGAMKWTNNDKRLINDNIKTLKEFNVKWVILIPEWFVFPNVKGTEIKPYYDEKTFPNPTGWITPSLTDDELESMIKKLNSNNIKVVLKPHIDPIDFGVNVNSSRGTLKPNDWDEFFDNYNQFILHYAVLAQKNNLPVLVIGTELDTVIREMPNAEKKWRDLIKEVRKVYTGKITYSVSCFNDCYSPSQVKFWDSLDYIGFEPYFGLTNKNNPSIKELKNAFDEKLEKYAKPLNEKYNKPVILTEANVYSYNGVNKHPINQPDSSVDYQEQADYFEAMFESITEKNWIKGIYWWGWYLDSTNSQWNNKNDLYDPFVRKPAGKIMKKWYELIES